ncbi:MAG: DUF418 domain-containing protein [Pseudomonadota bacterium]|nr:DUF418 domain-containing protein [Pseudomonadota bacterium]
MQPTAQRIDTLDVLRGLAVLGILVMNIQFFAMPMAAYLNPSAYGSLDGLNGMVWGVSHLLTDQKMMALFSMLFGAGIVLFCERADAAGRSVAKYYYRRNLWLLVFGLLHGYLLWSGDILFLYAVCACLLYPLRNKPVRTLIKLSVFFLAVSSFLYLLTGLGLQSMSGDEIAAEIMPQWRPTAEQMQAELAAYQGGWISQMAVRVPMTQEMQGLAMLMWGFWRASGLMLLGMALFKTDIITGRAERVVYLRLLWLGLAVGLPLVLVGIFWNFNNDWQLTSMFIGSQFNYWGSVLVSLMWMALIVLALKSHRMAALTHRLAATGRMAFTNYIMQTLICGFIFYGHGLGLIGQVERWGQILIVFGVWVLQLWLSPVWLRHFRFGPLEWLWRSLTYRQLQPLRRAAST